MNKPAHINSEVIKVTDVRTLNKKLRCFTELYDIPAEKAHLLTVRFNGVVNGDVTLLDEILVQPAATEYGKWGTFDGKDVRYLNKVNGHVTFNFFNV